MRSRLLAGFAAIAALLLPSAALAGPNDWAVIIGNSDYTGNVPKVAYAHNDAKEFKNLALKVFGVPEKNIIAENDIRLSTFFRLFGRTIHRQGRLYQSIKHKAAKIYVFYSGHGMPGPSLSSSGKAAYLLPIGGDPSSPDLDGYALEDLIKSLRGIRREKVPDGQVMLFVDACFSGRSDGGDVIKNTSGVGVTVDLSADASDDDDVVVITAARGNELASWDRERKSGLFTDTLISGLFGFADQKRFNGNGDKTVSLAELKAFMTARIPDRLRTLYPGEARRQHATFYPRGSEENIVIASFGSAYPIRDPQVLAQEQSDSAYLLQFGTAEKIAAFLKRCIHCPERAKLEARRRERIALKSTCRAELRNWRRIKSSGSLAQIRFAMKSPCPEVRTEAKEYASKFERVCKSEGRKLKTAIAESKRRLLEQLAAGARCSEVRIKAGRRVERMISACSQDRADWASLRSTLDVTKLKRFAARAECRPILSKIKKRIALLERACSAEARTLLDAGKVRDLDVLTKLGDGANCVSIRPRAKKLAEAVAERCKASGAKWDELKESKDLVALKAYKSSPDTCRHHARLASGRLAKLQGKISVGNEFRDCATCPKVMVLPPACFVIGSPRGERRRYHNEGPLSIVRMARPVAIGVYEVTVGEWAKCHADGKCGTAPPDGVGDRQPMTGITWRDAREFTEWLSDLTGKTYRLPSEAEWEYAARAGSYAPYSTGRRIKAGQANYRTKRGGSGAVRTKTVGSYAPNKFGIYDMHGNVSEWVADCYAKTHAGRPSDASARKACVSTARVVRGGGWRDRMWRIRSAYREAVSPSKRSSEIGFRIARDVPELAGKVPGPSSCGPISSIVK